MKSIITKLSSLLLCGAVALTGCTDFSADIQGMDKEISAELAALETQVQELEKKLSDQYATKLELEALNQELTDEMKKLQDNKADKTEIAALQEQIDATNARIDLIEDELEAIQAKFDTLNAEIDQKFADMDAAFKAEIQALNDLLAQKAAGIEADIAQKLADIKAAYEAADAAAIAKINEAIATETAHYNELSGRIDALEAALAELQSVLRSIVMVPELMVDGVNAVEFKSFVYVPMADADDTVPAVEGADPSVVKSFGFPSYAYYHFNPSTFDITKATYSIVSTNVTTKAAGDPVAAVKSVSKDGDKVKVELVRGEGTDNMFALAATLNDGAVVYSDYAKVYDEHLTADDIKFVNKDGNELNYTLVGAQAASADVVIESDKPFSLADYAKVEGVDLDTYGLSYAYSVVSGDIKVAADGTVDMTNIGGISIAKIELVDADGDVVRRAYVKFDITRIEVLVPGLYFKSSATATVEAARIAFEIDDIYAWAKALKDEPNTKEILAEVAGIAKTIAEIQISEKPQAEKNYLIKEEIQKAYTLLNGVPGFVYKYRTFTAEAEASAKVDIVPEIMTVRELRAALQMIAETYPSVDLMNELAQTIESYIPAQVKSNPAVVAIIAAIKNINIYEIINNERVFNLLESAEVIVSKFLDYDAINDKLEEVIKGVVGDANYGKEAAKIASQVKARAAAEVALEAEVAAANDELLANFENGTWAKLLGILDADFNLDNPAVAFILDKMGLTGTAAALQEFLPQIADQGRELVKYTYDADDVVYSVTDPVEYEVQ